MRAGGEPQRCVARLAIVSGFVDEGSQKGKGSICGIAPAVTINGKVYPKMTVDAVAGVVEEYRMKEANA